MIYILIFAIATTGPRSLLESYYIDTLELLEYIDIRIELSRTSA